MIDDNKLELTRRNALAGIGGIGVASAGAGLGTSAYFSDEESFEGNSLTAGELQLSATWQQLYYGASQEQRPGDYGDAERPFVNAYPDHNGDGIQSFDRGEDGVHDYVDPDDYHDPEEAAKAGRNLEFTCDEIDTFDEPSFDPNDNALIELDDVKPGDCGEVTFGIKLCDNPGYVWLSGELGEKSYGDHEESDTAHLVDEIIAKAWYDLDGDNVYDPGEPVIVQGSLRSVLDELSSGQMLAFEPDVAPDEDEDEAVEAGEGDVCVPLPKEDDEDEIKNLSAGDTFEYTVNGEDITIEITEVYFESGEPVGFDWKSATGTGICQVRVRGGPPTPGDPPGEGPVTAYEGCPTEGAAFAPENDRNRNREFHQISNFRFYYCDVDEEEENGEECFQPSNTEFIAFEWCLPPSVGNEVQGDSVSFDLSFYTEQCRHNDEPSGPANGT